MHADQASYHLAVQLVRCRGSLNEHIELYVVCGEVD